MSVIETKQGNCKGASGASFVALEDGIDAVAIDCRDCRSRIDIAFSLAKAKEIAMQHIDGQCLNVEIQRLQEAPA